MDGILVIRKEKGYTSHDVVAKLRGILHMKKIGHTGTLDPAAEGVLPVALGKGTRLVELLTEKEKTYEAVLRLGVSTDTQDMTGAVLSEKPVTVTEEEVREELKKGNMEKVNDLLGIPFFVDGVIEHGRGMGHKVLLPTTNIVPAKEKLMPPNGVYDTVSHFKDRTLCGITNVGYKPTIGEKFLGVETYLFDCEEDLYGEPCRVEFFHYSRPEKRFSSIEALKQQLLKDAEKGKAYFRSLEK